MCPSTKTLTPECWSCCARKVTLKLVTLPKAQSGAGSEWLPCIRLRARLSTWRRLGTFRLPAKQPAVWNLCGKQGKHCKNCKRLKKKNPECHEMKAEKNGNWKFVAPYLSHEVREWRNPVFLRNAYSRALIKNGSGSEVKMSWLAPWNFAANICETCSAFKCTYPERA